MRDTKLTWHRHKRGVLRSNNRVLYITREQQPRQKPMWRLHASVYVGVPDGWKRCEHRIGRFDALAKAKRAGEAYLYGEPLS